MARFAHLSPVERDDLFREVGLDVRAMMAKKFKASTISAVDLMRMYP